nr:MAG TPA: putative tail component [Caudoviricetes sp.]
MSDVKLIGFDKLEAKFKKSMNMDAVKTVVKGNGAQLQTKAQKNAPVGTPQSTGIPGYVGGKLKQSIGLEITGGGMTAEVEPSAEYAAYVEYGTRYMDAQPYLKPAYDEQKQKFVKDLNELVR